MDLRIENPTVVMAALALLSVSAACLITLYYRDERPKRRPAVQWPPARPTFVRLSDYRQTRRRDRPAA
jgi:hypothetical protein